MKQLKVETGRKHTDRTEKQRIKRMRTWKVHFNRSSTGIKQNSKEKKGGKREEEKEKSKRSLKNKTK